MPDVTTPDTQSGSGIPAPIDLKTLYLSTFDSRDAQLVRMRDRDYAGDTRSMIEKYKTIGNHPGADSGFIDDVLQRLENIRHVEEELKARGLYFKGAPLGSVTPLVDEFEKDRPQKKGLGGSLNMLLSPYC